MLSLFPAINLLPDEELMRLCAYEDIIVVFETRGTGQKSEFT